MSELTCYQQDIYTKTKFAMISHLGMQICELFHPSKDFFVTHECVDDLENILAIINKIKDEIIKEL